MLKDKIKALKIYKKMQIMNTSWYLLLTHPVETIKYRINLIFIKTPKVRNIKNSIQEIVNTDCSLSRFGDGEFRWISKNASYSFQKNDSKLSERLLEVLQSDLKNHYIGIPNVFSGVGELNKSDGLAWEKLINKYGRKWGSYLSDNKVYLDANLSRPYIDRENKENSVKYFESLKKLWQGKNVLIVEGNKTRFGVNNDLLSGALCVRRILCPAKNAFDSYNQILKSIITHHKKKEIVLIALGPTATILCFDLCKVGIRAIDIGHLDIEYEWFQNGENEKKPIEGKYVNEVKGGTIVTDTIIDSNFRNQVIDRIN